MPREAVIVERINVGLTAEEKQRLDEFVDAISKGRGRRIARSAAVGQLVHYAMFDEEHRHPMPKLATPPVSPAKQPRAHRARPEAAQPCQPGRVT